MSTNIQGVERPAPRAEKTVVDVQDSDAILAAYARAAQGGTVEVIPRGDMTKPYVTGPELTAAHGPVTAHGTRVSRSELRLLRGAYRSSAWRHFKNVFFSQWQMIVCLAKVVSCQYRIWRTPAEPTNWNHHDL